ncbi:MAG: DUF1015 domain-containing protein [Planctomycetaceae bacterium]|jgi:uncharacterized protein (DUF1015 family)|nr:DUF1015 domain-containing protein [Planctomycetaceae bacterium]
MDIKPFSGYRYNNQKIKNLDDVVAPPYDVIDDTLQEELYTRHPNNVIRLILNKISHTDDAEDNRYTRTAGTLVEWKNEKILVQDEKPAIYVYHQIFEADGQMHTRKGFMCVCRAVPFGYGMVYPHEMTMNAPKLDRLMLTTACKMNFSQIFGLYPDEKNKIQQNLETVIETGTFPFAEATDHLGVVHRMWVVDDAETIAAVVKEMESKPIFIADGHHRYETACNYRMQVDDMGLLTSDHPANYVLMVCVAMEDSGLLVLPTHRLFPGLPELSSEELKIKLGNCFTTEEVGNSPDAAYQVWQRIEKEKRQDAIGLHTAKDGKWLLTTITQSGRDKMNETAAGHHPEWRELGVSLLHCLIIETLLGNKDYPKPTYVHQVDEVVTELKQGNYPLAALVMPATVGHIKSLSILGDRMPAKSTYFYPKLIVGFVFNPLE